MAAAGFGADLLVANEVVDARRLEALAALDGDVMVTVAIDSAATLDAAARAGLRHCVVDVDVGLPRCGCAPGEAGRLADAARARGLTVRGVMGYEGHLMMVADRAEQRERVEAAMALLRAAHEDVGGDIVSAGGTGTYDLHDRTGITELQAGSYALMDTAYGTLGLPFGPALSVVGTVIAVKSGYAVADVGLKALGMDHGNPSIPGAKVWFCSDEHITFNVLDAAGEGAGAPAVPTPGLHHRTTRPDRPRCGRRRRWSARRADAGPHHRTTRPRPPPMRPANAEPRGEWRPSSGTGCTCCRPTSTRRWRCTRSPGSCAARRSSTAGRSTCAAGDETSRRGATALAWACVATGAGILVSPLAHLVHRRYNTLEVIAQSLVHWAGLLAVPPALVAARSRNRRLGLAAGSIGVGGLAAAAWIAGRPEPATSAPVVTVAHFNLLYLNERLALDLAAIAATGADVLTFSEVTPRHLATLQHSALARHYPYRIERPGPYAAGTALWSRLPVSEVDGPVLEHHTVAGDVDLGPSGPVRVIVIHTRSPMHHFGEWADDLAELAGTFVPDEPAVMIGDFNAGWGHPDCAPSPWPGGVTPTAPGVVA